MGFTGEGARGNSGSYISAQRQDCLGFWEKSALLWALLVFLASEHGTFRGFPLPLPALVCRQEDAAA